MQSFTLSEESESVGNECDLTNHHDNISFGIMSIQKIYETSNSDARNIVEAAYVEYLSKLPKKVQNFKNILGRINNYESVKTLQTAGEVSINLLKCLNKSGFGSVRVLDIQGFLPLSIEKNSYLYKGNLLKELNIEISFSDRTQYLVRVNLFEKFGLVSLDQIMLSKNFGFFVNEKTTEFDLCLYLNVILGKNDRAEIVKLKAKDTQRVIKKLRVDSMGIDIQKEFKQSCCDCLVF